MAAALQTENHLKTGGEQREFANKTTAGSVSDDCYPTYEQMKIRRKHKFIVFKIDGETEQIVVELAGPKKGTLDDMKAALPDTECRYVVYEHEFKTPDGRPTDTLYFMSWMPHNSTPYNKMAYAQAKSVIREILDGVLDISCSSIAAIDPAITGEQEEEEEDPGDPDDW